LVSEIAPLSDKTTQLWGPFVLPAAPLFTLYTGLFKKLALTYFRDSPGFPALLFKTYQSNLNTF